MDHLSRNVIKYTDHVYKSFSKECLDTAYLNKLVAIYSGAQNDLKDQVFEYKKVDFNEDAGYVF